MRPINADALKEWVENVTDSEWGWQEMLDKIDAEPTIDAVPVVRCRECRYNYGKEHGGEFNPEDIVCDYWETDGLNADDFCSYGERSEE